MDDRNDTLSDDAKARIFDQVYVLIRGVIKIAGTAVAYYGVENRSATAAGVGIVAVAAGLYASLAARL